MTRSVLNYLAASVAPSLYRNGRVYTRRDRGGSDEAWHGAIIEQRQMTIRDARELDQDGLLDGRGFELRRRPLADPDLDFLDHRQVVERYYAECAGIVEQATGASKVLAFDHNIRWAEGRDSGARIAGGQQVQGPIHVVHGDYTLASAPQRLRDLAQPPGANDTLRSVLPEGESLLDPGDVERLLEDNGRFALINVWRNIDREPVARDPLALCNGRSVAPGDLVVFEIHYSDRIGENYFARHAPGHDWWYYPGVTRDEVILIKQWDAAGGLARSGGRTGDGAAGEAAPSTFSFHSAFSDPATHPDAPQRQSIEVRCVVIY